MARYLGAVTLRNERHIYEDGDRFFVEDTDKHGRVYRDEVPLGAVGFLQSVFKGSVATAEDAQNELEPIAERLNLPYTYGYKLRFYAQSVLLVLVARGEAEVEKRGRAYHYTVW